MCLVFKTRCSTKDVDGIFAPAAEMREAIRSVGRMLDVAVKYYPEKIIPVRTRFFVEELLQ